jgi:hypothetical protein
MGSRCCVVAFVLVYSGVARAAGQEVLYLNFSDGTENVIQADTDDAGRNRTIMGTATPYPTFTWPGVTDDASRRALIEEMTHRIEDAFAAYDIVVTTTRPSAGPYNMVMIGGDPSVFKMDARVAGVAYMDCENRQLSNLVFAFPYPLGGSLHGLFSTIAQEAGHALGLQHSSDPTDLMYPRVDVSQRSFQDRETPVASPRYCDGQTQNSHKRLLQLVGARGEPAPARFNSQDQTAPAMGCQVGGAGRGRAAIPEAFTALLAVFALRACRRRRGRL